jgi:hypothetical protein
MPVEEAMIEMSLVDVSVCESLLVRVRVVAESGGIVAGTAIEFAFFVITGNGHKAAAWRNSKDVEFV